MKRFIIRNYGPSRQVPYKDKQIFIAADCVVETDDAAEANALASQDRMHLHDRGDEFAPASIIVEPVKAPGTSDDEIPYEEMTVPELKAIAEDRELEVKGLKKAQIIEALRAYDETPDKPEVPDATDEPETADEPDATDDKERKVTVDDAEAVHKEKSLDEDENENEDS